jgi:malate synthase
MEVFQAALGSQANQKEVLRLEVNVAGSQLVDTHVPGGTITEAGFRNNVNVALQYLNSWLSGNGAVAIFNLMEDAATAEISRAQLWQWITNKATLDDGTVASAQLYQKIREEELLNIGGRDHGRMPDAIALLDSLVLNPEFMEFLTLPAYRLFE